MPLEGSGFFFSITRRSLLSTVWWHIWVALISGVGSGLLDRIDVSRWEPEGGAGAEGRLRPGPLEAESQARCCCQMTCLGPISVFVLFPLFLAHVFHWGSRQIKESKSTWSVGRGI